MGNRPPQRSQSNQSGIPQNISEGTLQQLLELEGQRLQLHMLRQQSRDKEIDANTKLAEKSIEAQREFLKAKPSQDRKTFTLFSVVVIIILAMFALFMCYLLHSGNKDFAHSILIGLSHVAVGGGSYYAGTRMRKSHKPTTENDLQDAEIVE